MFSIQQFTKQAFCFSFCYYLKTQQCKLNLYTEHIIKILNSRFIITITAVESKKKISRHVLKHYNHELIQFLYD